jgi:hypothetical protein
MVISTWASSSEALRMQAVSWLVNWGLGGRWTRRGRSLRYGPPLSHYRLTLLGSSSMLFLHLARLLSVARSYAKRGELPGVYKLSPARAPP